MLILSFSEQGTCSKHLTAPKIIGALGAFISALYKANLCICELKCEGIVLYVNSLLELEQTMEYFMDPQQEKLVDI